MIRLANYSSTFSTASITITKAWLTQHKTVLLLILISGVLCLIHFDDIMVGTFYDDAHYLVLAESLITGQGYHLISIPGAPVENAFPPGWPLLLAPIVGLFPANLTIPKLLSLFFSLASIPLMVKLFATQLNSVCALAITALVSLNPFWAGAAGTVMSEPAYLFFSLLTLTLFEVWYQDKTRIWLLVVVFLLALYTLMIRTIGLTLLMAILFYLLFHYRRRNMILIIGSFSILVLIPLGWFNYRNGGAFVFSETYFGHVNYVVSHWKDFGQFWNSTLDFESIATYIVPIFDLTQIQALITPLFNRWLSILLLLVILFGFLLSWQRYQVKEIYFGLYFIIFYVWTIYIEQVQARHLIPLLPFFYFYLVRAISWFVGFLAYKRERKVLSFTLGLLGLLLVILLIRNFHEWRYPLRDRVVDLSVGTTWIRDNTPPDSIIIAVNATPDYLYSRRKTQTPGHETEDLAEHIKRSGSDYILIQPFLWDWDNNHQLNYTMSKWIAFLKANPDKYKRVFWNNDQNISVYQVLETR